MEPHRGEHLSPESLRTAATKSGRLWKDTEMQERAEDSLTANVAAPPPTGPLLGFPAAQTHPQSVTQCVFLHHSGKKTPGFLWSDWKTSLFLNTFFALARALTGSGDASSVVACSCSDASKTPRRK